MDGDDGDLLLYAKNVNEIKGSASDGYNWYQIYQSKYIVGYVGEVVVFLSLHYVNTIRVFFYFWLHAQW